MRLCFSARVTLAALRDRFTVAPPFVAAGRSGCDDVVRVILFRLQYHGEHTTGRGQTDSDQSTSVRIPHDRGSLKDLADLILGYTVAGDVREVPRIPDQTRRRRCAIHSLTRPSAYV